MMALRAEAILEPIAILSLKKIGVMNKNYVTLSVRRSINMGGLGNIYHKMPIKTGRKIEDSYK